VFYGDPPWKDGAALFDARLGLTDRKYAGLMLGLQRIIASVAPRPVVMVMGKSGLKFLSPPDEICKTRLNGAEAIAACWRIAAGNDWGSATAVLSDLASRYRVAGDFFCGYGRTAEYFAEPERSCILSDYNPKCIGGVASRFGK
jgi:hypothetical protein